MNQTTDKKGMIEVLTCYLLWGVLPVFWKLLAEVDSVYVLASRVVWSAVFCFLIIVFTGKMNELKTVLKDRKMMKTLLCSGIAVAINWGFYIYAVNSGHILDGSLAYYLNPILAIVIAFVVFKEPIMRLQWVAIGIAALGIITAILMYRTVPVFALIIGTSFAIYGAIKKNVTCSSLVSTFIEATFISPIGLAYIVWAENNGVGVVGTLEGAEFLLLAASGIVTSVPLLVYSAGIKKIPLSLSGIMMYINPTIQLLIGIVLYGEKFDVARGIMFVCVWIAVCLFISAGRKKPQLS